AAQAFLIARGEGEAGSGSGELAGAGGADAFGSSSDEHHLAVNSHGIALAQAAVAAQKRHNSTMAKGLIPLFPLQLVVFPRVHLPLHIYENRYKEMVGDAIRDGAEFGIVLAKEDGILNAGCTVMVEKVLEMYPDGRMDVMTRGQRRFEIVSLNQEKEYLQAEVEFFDDDDLAPVPAELRDRALSNYRALSRLASARGHGDPDFEDPQVSFQVEQAVRSEERRVGKECRSR